MLGHWKSIGPKWVTKDAYRVMEVLRENGISWRMPADDMFFTNAFHLPHPVRRWAVLVKRRDRVRAIAVLKREDLM